MKACEGRDRTLTSAHHVENSIFYSDKFKLIACFPLKAGTTNWQKLLAKVNGQTDEQIKKWDEGDYGNYDPDRFRKLIKTYGKTNLISEMINLK